VDELSQEYRLILLDLKGHGCSERVRDSHYSTQDHAAVVTGLIEHLGLSDAVLVGHSLGAAIALHVALADHRNASQRVSGMILIGACSHPKQLPLALRALGMPVIGWLAMKLIPCSVRTRMILRLELYDDKKITDALVELRARYESVVGTDYAFIKTAQGFRESFSEAQRQDLRQLQIPALHILGEHDRIIARSAALQLCALLPRCPLATVKATGHLPQEEAPHEVLGLIKDFMLNAAH
jgi:pyruvate dehydrogenase E2 component (dihydrolipoamide acetyltransferase)